LNPNHPLNIATAKRGLPADPVKIALLEQATRSPLRALGQTTMPRPLLGIHAAAVINPKKRTNPPEKKEQWCEKS